MSPHTVSGKRILLLQTVVITKYVRGPPPYRFSVAVSLVHSRVLAVGACVFFHFSTFYVSNRQHAHVNKYIIMSGNRCSE